MKLDATLLNQVLLQVAFGTVSWLLGAIVRVAVRYSCVVCHRRGFRRGVAKTGNRQRTGTASVAEQAVDFVVMTSTPNELSFGMVGSLASLPPCGYRREQVRAGCSCRSAVAA